MTLSATLEALHMLEPLFFLHLLELNVWATIYKMSRFMTSVAHGVRELSFVVASSSFFLSFFHPLSSFS